MFCAGVGADVWVEPNGAWPLVFEQGATSDTYTISLPTAPAANVNIYLRQLCDPNQLSMPSTVTFTPGDWSPRTVTVTAIDDALLES
jgi:hypothetical protein